MNSKEASDRRKLVARLLKKYGAQCFYCPQPLDMDNCTVDHYVPRAAGGSNHIDNLRPSCFPCNNWKADRVPNADGSIPPKVGRVRVSKAERPFVCMICFSGRDLAAGEQCWQCKTGPKPEVRPHYLKRKTWLCDHDVHWCIACCIMSEEDRLVLALKSLGLRQEAAEVAATIEEEVVA